MSYVIIKEGCGEIVEKKSRFIATVKKIKSEEEANVFISEMKKKYWDARHNCSAYVIGEKNEIMRFSDDGEPSSTAGKPILDVIISKNITNIAIVVTRYFGGILLGTGGLVRAYQKAATEGLNQSIIAKKCNGKKGYIYAEYTKLGKIQYLANSKNINIGSIEYTDKVKIPFICEEEQALPFTRKVMEITNGSVKFSEMESIQYYITNDGIQEI